VQISDADADKYETVCLGMRVVHKYIYTKHMGSCSGTVMFTPEQRILHATRKLANTKNDHYASKLRSGTVHGIPKRGSERANLWEVDKVHGNVKNYRLQAT